MIAAIISLFGSVISGVGSLISVETLKFLAIRGLIMFSLFIALPVVLYNVLTSIIFDFMSYALSFMSAQGLSANVIHFTGLGAYLAQQIQLPQAFSVYMSFVLIAFLMRFIPFFK